MGQLRKVNTGGLSFSRMRDGDKYYVDKSLLIDDLLSTDENGVYLFTRPRRFGKSTNISMLDAFFNLRYEGNTWFDGLAISEHPEYEQYRNAFPVVCIDLKDTVPVGKNRDYDMFLRRFGDTIQRTFSGFKYLLDSDSLNDRQKTILHSVIYRSADEATLKTSVLELCMALEAHHGRKAIVLIDEYDRAVTDVFGTDLRKQIVDFLGVFLSMTLKSNESLQMAYVTGVMQVTNAGMFSWVNNLSVNNVFSARSDERFGFTENEVMEILEYYGRSDRFDEVRDWYDGYRFGNADVYNPFSVMSYVQNGFRPAGYWANSGTDAPIRWMLDRAGRDMTGTVSRLISGESVSTDIHLDMTYDDMHALRETDLLSLMVMTGYLKAVPAGDGSFDVSIPNREVMGIVDGILKRLVRFEPTLFDTFCRAVTAGDAAGMESAIERILAGASHYDLGNERSYELVLLTVMRGMLRDYDVRSEAGTGNGRADLLLAPRSPGTSPTIIIELKIAGSADSLDARAEAALEQIHSRRYYSGIDGKVILIGIAFHGVLARVRAETLRPAASLPRQHPLDHQAGVRDRVVVGQLPGIRPSERQVLLVEHRVRGVQPEQERVDPPQGAPLPDVHRRGGGVRLPDGHPGLLSDLPAGGLDGRLALLYLPRDEGPPGGERVRRRRPLQQEHPPVHHDSGRDGVAHLHAHDLHRPGVCVDDDLVAVLEHVDRRDPVHHRDGRDHSPGGHYGLRRLVDDGRRGRAVHHQVVHHEGPDGAALALGEHQHPAGHVPAGADPELAGRSVYTAQEAQRLPHDQGPPAGPAAHYRAPLDYHITSSMRAETSLHMAFCEQSVGR